MNKLPIIAGIALGLSLAGAANADSRWAQNDVYQDSARVLRAQPIYETVSVTIPEEHCRTVSRPHRSGHHRDSYTQPLLGAIVGGVVGNQFGKGRGNTAMTVAGTLLGASIANDMDRHRGPVHHRPQRECEIVERHETREELVGYRVKYKYKGRIYHTRMDYDPGDTLPVSVSVSPIH